LRSYLAADEVIEHLSQPVTPDETRRLGWERATISTSRRINIKIVTLGSHAFDYVPASRIVHIALLATLEKAVGFILASSHVRGFAWRTASQINHRQHGHCTCDVLHCSAGQLLRRLVSNRFVDQPIEILPVAGFVVFRRQAPKMLRGYESLQIRDFLRTADEQSLSVLDGTDELCRL
jgi:hypothetical protein